MEPGNLLDQQTVDAPSLNAFKNRLSRTSPLSLAGGRSCREAAQGKSHKELAARPLFGAVYTYNVFWSYRVGSCSVLSPYSKASCSPMTVSRVCVCSGRRGNQGAKLI